MWCSSLLRSAKLDEQLDTEDGDVMMQLLTLGHPELTQKMHLTSADGAAVPVSVIVHNRGDKALGRAFALVKSDGSPPMDFSYRRCIAGLKKKALQGSLPSMSTSSPQLQTLAA